MSTAQIDENKIAEAAFFLWLNEGQPQGREEAHWHQARVSLEGELTPVKPRRASRPKAAPKAAAAKTTAAKTAAAKPKTTRAKAAAAKTTATATKAPAKRKTAATKTTAAE